MTQELFAGLREQNATSRAVDETAAHFDFERLDRVTDGALREVQFFGRARKALASSQGGEGSELPAVERAVHE